MLGGPFWSGLSRPVTDSPRQPPLQASPRSPSAPRVGKKHWVVKILRVVQIPKARGALLIEEGLSLPVEFVENMCEVQRVALALVDSKPLDEVAKRKVAIVIEVHNPSDRCVRSTARALQQDVARLKAFGTPLRVREIADHHVGHVEPKVFVEIRGTENADVSGRVASRDFAPETGRIVSEGFADRDLAPQWR